MSAVDHGDRQEVHDRQSDRQEADEEHEPLGPGLGDRHRDAADADGAFELRGGDRAREQAAELLVGHQDLLAGLAEAPAHRRQRVEFHRLGEQGLERLLGVEQRVFVGVGLELFQRDGQAFADRG